MGSARQAVQSRDKVNGLSPFELSSDAAAPGVLARGYNFRSRHYGAGEIYAAPLTCGLINRSVLAVAEPLV